MVKASPLEILGKLKLPVSVGAICFETMFVVTKIDLDGLLGLDFLSNQNCEVVILAKGN